MSNPARQRSIVRDIVHMNNGKNVSHFFVQVILVDNYAIREREIYLASHADHATHVNIV